jgi:RNA polymerase sporulation-specific sigma factor
MYPMPSPGLRRRRARLAPKAFRAGARGGRRPDATRLTDAQRDLAEAYLSLAHHLANRFAWSCPRMWADYRGVACLALVEAARSFDPSRGLRFATFARFRIRTRLYAAMPDSDALPLDFDVVDDAPPVALDCEAADDLEALIRPLPPRCRDVLRARFLGDMSRLEVAALLGISESGVAYREALAFDLLRKAS